MVKVYFETLNHSYAELVAVIASEEIYDAIYPSLEEIANKNRMVVTESVVYDFDIESLPI